jgi:hypothetical protein
MIFTVAERAALEEALGVFLTQTANIMRRQVSQSDDGQIESWVLVATAPCFVTTTPTPVIVANQRVAMTVNSIVIYMPTVTPVQPGDRINIGSRTYVVEDVTTEATHNLLLRITARARE